MNSLYVWKEEMQKLYARYAKYIDKVFQLNSRIWDDQL